MEHTEERLKEVEEFRRKVFALEEEYQLYIDGTQMGRGFDVWIRDIKCQKDRYWPDYEGQKEDTYHDFDKEESKKFDSYSE